MKSCLENRIFIDLAKELIDRLGITFNRKNINSLAKLLREYDASANVSQTQPTEP